MIIQCDHCSAKFRMDDSKLAKGPVKVRCAKCKEIFSVSKVEPSLETSPEIAPSPQNEELTPAAGLSAREAAPSAVGVSGVAATADYSSSGTDFSLNFDETPAPTASAASFAAADVAAAGFDLSTAGAAPSRHGGDLDLSFDAGGGEFDFGDIPAPESSLAATAGRPASTAEDDFSMDFGEVSFSEPLTTDKPVSAALESAGSPDLPGKPSLAADFPTAADENADFDFSFKDDVVAAGATPEPAAPEVGAVNFGDFDFGETNLQAGAQTAPVIEKQPLEFSPFTEESANMAALSAPLDDDSDIPPSLLSSRKKRSSFFPLTVILGAILLVILLAGSAVYFVSGPKAFSKVGLGFLVDWYGAKGGEEGSVSVRNISAEYMINKEAGELFVVRGEALNNYNKPRASIQVKVTVLGAGGVSLLTKTAFCGNSLSKEQLAGLPLAKLEETMNNQFGDSLANMGVKPGNVIPFVVVLNNVPKDAKDYSVQISGSTIATQ